MSHQANFLGHHQHAVDLARGAQRGANGHAPPTVMALFYAMEARGLAALGDEKGVTKALIAAERWHAQSAPESDPVWIRHFDSAELHAEFAHCFRDLRFPDLASMHALTSIHESSNIYVRSLSFCRMVLATAYLLGKELHQAIAVAQEVIDVAVTLKSSRVRSYLNEFQQRLVQYGTEAQVTTFREYMADQFSSENSPTAW